MTKDVLVARASKVWDPAQEAMACRRCFLSIDSMSAAFYIFKFLVLHTLPKVHHGTFVESTIGVVFCVGARSHRRGRPQVPNMVPTSRPKLIWTRVRHDCCPHVKKCLVQTCCYNNVSQRTGFEARDCSMLSRLNLRLPKFLL
jgi:hypothetical protein